MKIDYDLDELVENVVSVLKEIGLDFLQEMAKEMTEQARQVIAPLGEKALKLDILAEYLLSRKG